MHTPRNDVTLFEVSWEVCNKVGGIYAVVSSKLLEVVDSFGENYFLIGPDLTYNANFEETNEECWAPLKIALDAHNIRCRFGRWSIPGRPKVILVSYQGHYNTNQLLSELWSKYGVDSLLGGWDYVEPVLFSALCGEVIAIAHQTIVTPTQNKSVAHFHEWMCGAGLLMLKKMAPEVGTVFTTHATVLGRAMASSDINIYNQMKQISPKQEAAAHNITAKCSMESIAAKEADCFTTVSNITGNEASVFLGRVPDILTYNGVDLRVIPDYAEDRTNARLNRRKILEDASKLLRKDLPLTTRIFIISGRYEFHNKGIDVFLDALAEAEKALQQTNTPILGICAVMGGHTGINAAAVGGDPEARPDYAPNWITSHNIYNVPQDPIINTCKRLNLVNGPENNVNVIFNPALLDGNDGFFNMSYYELLASCDLGVFPSWYEPWGYTPQESAAYCVPTVTTDLSGFGLWARSLHEQRGGQSGVTVIARHQSTYDQVVHDLREILLEYATCPLDVIDTRRKSVRFLATHCTWKQFFPYYIKAYSHAINKAAERTCIPSVDQQKATLKQMLITSSSATPNLHGLTAVATLPHALHRLRELANNLWWSWQPDAIRLFSLINAEYWENSAHNPIALIEQADPFTLQKLSTDQEYLTLYDKVMAEFDSYMNKPISKFGEKLHSTNPIAYFSTEFGLHESLPIYSGGLGVLSGDHLKAASDLALPLIGIGLFYKNGYFKQTIDSQGRQVATYPENDTNLLPLEKIHGTDGTPIEIDLDLPGRKLYAQVWLVRVGRIKLYLLDSNLPKNTEEDKSITARLYEADRDIRIRQEILLGMGGVRFLQRMGITPSVYHINEGHSAFMVFERLQRYILDKGLTLREAKELIRSSTVFTTHTPVDAGNERFTVEIMNRYFANYAKSIQIPFEQLLQFGQYDNENNHTFEMTILALKMSMKANGVSKVHGSVCRHMWHNLWKEVPTAEVPIGSVTNGVHIPSYVGTSMRILLEKQLRPDWLTLTSSDPAWKKIQDIPNKELVAAHNEQKSLLFQEIRKSLPAFFSKYSIPKENQAAYRKTVEQDKLDSLVICFARRFATYKRATLLFADLKRLEQILNNPERPVLVVFSGKAHPADEEGMNLIQSIIEHCKSPQFRGRIFFLENYNLRVSKLMAQGCDVWLNTPRRPYEASGTSGEKVPVNGGLNLSVSDGWWAEGQGIKNGWTIGPVVEKDYPSFEEQSDYADAEALYSLLEESVIPLYFARDASGFSTGWMEYVKNSLQTLTPEFNTARMLTEYLDEYYLPAATQSRLMQQNDYALAKEFAAWKFDVPCRFATLRILQVHMEGIENDTLICGRPFTVEVSIELGNMELNEVLVQLVIGCVQGEHFAGMPDIVRLEPEYLDEEQGYLFKGSYTAIRNGKYAYGIRVVPVTEHLSSIFATHLILWA